MSLDLDEGMTREHREEFFMKAYVTAVAAVASVGVSFGDAYTPDYGLDGTFAPITQIAGLRRTAGPIMNFQMKACMHVRQMTDKVAYDVESDTRNHLAKIQENNGLPTVLLVLDLPDVFTNWWTHNRDNLIPRRCCYFYQVDDTFLTSNVRSQVLHIPHTETLSPEKLIELMTWARGIAKARRQGP